MVLGDTKARGWGAKAATELDVASDKKARLENLIISALVSISKTPMKNESSVRVGSRFAVRHGEQRTLLRKRPARDHFERDVSKFQ